ncbi:DUF3500 domain-containing protein [Oceaniferula spumae]
MLHSTRAITCLAASLFLTSVTARAGDFETTFRKEVSAFLNGLDESQSKACLYPVTDKNRWQMQFTGGKRPGILISKLSETQRAQLDKTLRLVLSAEGLKLAEAVAKQDTPDGIGKYWITCYGDPRKKENFAFRIAEHHLTVVHLEVAEGETKEFGPILLGSDPALVWQEDEKRMIEAWKKIADKKLLIKGKRGVSSAPMNETDGVAFTSINAAGQQALKEVWNHRLRIFTQPIQDRINRLHKARGGWEKSRVAFYNQEPEKLCIDGGRWDFKCGLPGMVWDLENSRGHIHLSLWVK